MAYERFWEAIEGYEEAYERFEAAEYRSAEALEQMRRNAEALFEALFDHYPPVPQHFRKLVLGDEERKERLERLLHGDEEEQERLKREVENPLWSAFNESGMLQYLGILELIVGPLDHLPTSDMLDRLRDIDSRLRSSGHEPDQDESGAGLETAINVKGSILFIAWLLSGYGDDLQPTHSELEQLLARYGLAFEEMEPVSKVNSLSKRVVAELAYQRGDYTAAFRGLAQAIASVMFSIFESESVPSNRSFPWLSKAEDRANEIYEMIKHAPNYSVDWPEVAKACDMLSEAVSTIPYPWSEWEVVPDLLWNERKGYALAQLTRDQFRDYMQSSEDERAAQRLQTYFFPGGLWEQLPERARTALVTADRMMVSSTLGRRAGILNETRIATEEVLHRYLWIPLSEWAAGQRSLHPGVKQILDKPEQSRRSPGIDDYVQLLWHSGAKDYFQSLGLSDDDVRFLTRENRTTKHLQTLQRTRNTAEHEPGSAISPSEVRDLYAESLGIGRKGILPELLRLLAPGKRGGG